MVLSGELEVIMENKLEAKIEMKNALEHLRDAWFECLCIFTDARIECNDYIMGTEENEYPFHMSFDELNTLNWIDGCLEKT